MGKKITQSLYLDPHICKKYADSIDVNPSHQGEDNGLLPPGCVSGLYLIELINRELFRYDEVLCATKLEIEWYHPVMPGDILKMVFSFSYNQRKRVAEFSIYNLNLLVSSGSIIQAVKT